MLELLIYLNIEIICLIIFKFYNIIFFFHHVRINLGLMGKIIYGWRLGNILEFLKGHFSRIHLEV